jgi:hypothetical protein
MASTSTDIRNESADDLLTTWRMRDLWMELNSIKWFGIVRDGSVWSRLRMANDVELCGHLR